MVRVIMLQIPVRRLALRISARRNQHRVLTRLELRLQFTLHVELTYLITHYANFSLYIIMYVRTAVLVYRTAHKRVVCPFIVINTVVRYAVAHEPLTFVHRKHCCAELQFCVVCFAEGDRNRVANRQHICCVVRLGRIIIGRVVKSLLCRLLDIPSVRVIGLEDMTESHNRNILHFDGIMQFPSSVLDHLNRIVILSVFCYRILVMQIPTQVAVTNHRIESHRKVLCAQRTR